MINSGSGVTLKRPDDFGGAAGGQREQQRDPDVAGGDVAVLGLEAERGARCWWRRWRW